MLLAYLFKNTTIILFWEDWAFKLGFGVPRE